MNKTENLYMDVINNVLEEVEQLPVGHTNNHLGPSWSPCDVCRIPFYFVGKRETRKSDLTYLSHKVGLGNTDPTINKAASLKCATQRGYGGEATHDIMNREMAKLSKETRWQLCAYFMNDFLLFDYHSKWCDFSEIVKKLLKNTI